MYKKSKRLLAGFLAFLLVVTMAPTDILSVVYAEEDAIVADVDASESVEATDDKVEAVVDTAKADDNEAVADDAKADNNESAVDDAKADDDDDALTVSDTAEDSDEVQEEVPDVEDRDTVSEDSENDFDNKAELEDDKLIYSQTTWTSGANNTLTRTTSWDFSSDTHATTTDIKGDETLKGLKCLKGERISFNKYNIKYNDNNEAVITPQGLSIFVGCAAGIPLDTDTSSVSVKITLNAHNDNRVATIGENSVRIWQKNAGATANKGDTNSNIAAQTNDDKYFISDIYEKTYTLSDMTLDGGNNYIKFVSLLGEWKIRKIEITETKSESTKKLGFKEDPSFTSTGNPKTPFDGDTLTVTFTANEDEERTPVIKWYKVSSENTETALAADTGSDGKKYTIKADDRGSKIKAVVTFEAVDGKDKVEKECTTQAEVTEKKFGFKKSPYFKGEDNSSLYPGETLTLDYELNETGTDDSEIKWELVKDENGTEKPADLTADENSNNKEYTVKKSDAGGKIRVTVTPKIGDKTGEPEKVETETVSEKLVTFKKEPVFTIEGGDLAYPKPGNKLTVEYELDKAAGETDASVITWTRVKDGQTTELTADANSDGKTYTVAEADVESKIKVSVTPKTDNEYVSDGETKDFISNEVKEAGFEPQKAYNMSLKASDIPSETYTSAFVKNGFTIHAGTNENSLYRSVTVEGNNKTINDTSYSARLKMSGPGTEEYRSVSFTAVKEATLAIACMSSNDSNSAKLKIATESGAEYTGTYKLGFGEGAAALTEKTYTAGGIVIDNKLNNANAAGTYIEVTLPAGTYYLYSDSAPAVNFYEIKVTYTDGGADYGESDYATVSFDKNGGINDIASQKILKGENCPEPAGPIRDGYIFKGWCTDAAGTTAYDFDQAVNADLTLYAAWEEDTTAEHLVLDMKDLPQGDYTSTFDYRGFTFAASDDKGLSVGASSATVKGKAYTQFLKLNGTGESACRNLSFTTTEVSTVTIVAVTGSSGTARDLALNNGSVVTTNPTDKKTINAADEYVFSDVPAGTWYLYSMKSGINIYYISVKPATVEITPTILDEDDLLNGEEVYFVSGTEEKKVTSGTTLDLKKNREYKLEVRDGDIVSTDLKAKINGSTTYIPTEDDSVDIIITEASEIVTITFMNGNDIIFEDEVEMSNPKEGVYYELAPVESKVNVPEGKEFLGWDLSSDAKAAVYYPAGYIYFRENVTLYAVIADIDAITYTVTFEDQYGDEIDATFVLEGGTITFDETYNEYENYVFAGWKLKGDKDPNKVYAVGETYTVTGDVTFVETWKLREYTVTLTDENGNVTKTQKVEAGKEFTFPETAPTKDGYTFAGWKKEYDDSAYGTGSKCVITEDVIFKETWAQPNKEDFTVTFEDEFGYEITDLTMTIKAGDDPVITLPKETPTERIGYKFVGWYDYWDGYSYDPGTSYVVTKNVVLSEHWEKEDYESGMYFRLDDEEAYYQGGAAVTPPVEVYYNTEELTLGTDYTVKYKNNKNAGEATLTITGKNNFAGAKKEAKFKIRQADIEGWTDYAGAMTVIKNAKVNPVITYNGKQLKLGKDFTISGAGLENGKYTSVTGNDADGKPIPNKLTVEGINNFTGTFDIEVIVVEKNGAPSLAVEIDRNFRPVYGEEVLDWATLFGETEIVNGQLVVTAPGKITVYEKGDRDRKPLAFSTYKGIQGDFEVVMVSGDFYSAGTQKFMIVGRGKYTGTVTKSFKILPKPLDEDDIQVGVYDWYNHVFNTDLTAEYSSTGSAVKGLTVRYYTGYRYEDMGSQNYKVSYSNNKKVGTGKVKITFINDYKGTKPKTVDFTITGASLNNTNAIAPDMVYSTAGKSYVSKPLVEYNGAILKASEYTVSYAWATETQCKDENGNRKADEDIRWTPAEGNRVNITLEDEDQYAKVKVMITQSARSNFITDKDYGTGKDIPKTTYYYVRKADPEKAFDLSKAKVEFFADADCSPDKQYKKIPYCGEVFYTPEGNQVSEWYVRGAVFVKVTVKVGRENQIVDPSLYDVTWLNATNKGKATVVIKGNGPDCVDKDNKFAVGSKTTSATIDSIGEWVKPSNPERMFGNFLKNIFGK